MDAGTAAWQQEPGSREQGNKDKVMEISTVYFWRM
jgi:hypothetical protein